MRQPEQRLWDAFRKHAAQQVWLQRIENIVGEGIPDVLSIGQGLTTFVELKANEEPPVRPTTALLGDKKGLSVAQRNWHTNCAQRGGRSMVLVGAGSGAARRIYLLDGRCADRINKMPEAEMMRRAIAMTWPGVIARLTETQN